MKWAWVRKIVNQNVRWGEDTTENNKRQWKMKQYKTIKDNRRQLGA